VELVARRLRVRVAFLDEEPVALALLDLHERPLAVELVTLELEEELSFLEPLTPIFEWDPFAAIPDDHAARTIVSGGDDPLEVAVFERMVFDLDGESFVGHVVRRALRHGPRPQDALHLEPEVEVQLPRGVLVHDEEAAV